MANTSPFTSPSPAQIKVEELLDQIDILEAKADEEEDRAEEQLQHAYEESERIKDERDKAETERNDAEAQRNRAEDDRDRAEIQRDAAIEAMGRALEERDRAVEERDAMLLERDRLQMELEELQAAYQAPPQSMAMRTRARIARLTKQRDAFRFQAKELNVAHKAAQKKLGAIRGLLERLAKDVKEFRAARISQRLKKGKEVETLEGSQRAPD